MNNIVTEVRDYRKNSFEEMIQRIAKAALIGARGNSGAILAQFFQGLAEVQPIAEGSPALSVHIGKGGTAIAVMGE